MNGGDPDNWDKMTPDEIQLIYTTHLALKKYDLKEMMEGLISIIKAVG